MLEYIIILMLLLAVGLVLGGIIWFLFNTPYEYIFKRIKERVFREKYIKVKEGSISVSFEILNLANLSYESFEQKYDPLLKEMKGLQVNDLYSNFLKNFEEYLKNTDYESQKRNKINIESESFLFYNKVRDYFSESNKLEKSGIVEIEDEKTNFLELAYALS